MTYVVLYRVLDLIFQVLYWALMIRILMSWVPHDRYHPIISKLYDITDPILRPFQNIVPSWKFGLDLSPIFAFLALSVARKLLFQLLF